MYVVSSNTYYSNMFNKIIWYNYKNDFLNCISDILIDDQKFNGIIKIPPTH